MVITAAESVRIARTRDPAAVRRLLAPEQPLEPLLDAATALREEGHGWRVSWSPTALLPLTRVCRDPCRSCAPAAPCPRAPLEQVLVRARQAAAAGCREVLFAPRAERPRRRWPVARRARGPAGVAEAAERLAHLAGRVLGETGLLPHVTGITSGREELALLRSVSASQGLLLGPVSAGRPVRDQTRLATIQLAGELHVPFTTGLRFGVGETLDERAEIIAMLAELVQQEHVQALVVQGGRAGPGTRLAAAAEPGAEELLRTAAVLRLAAGPQANVQVPAGLVPADPDPSLLLRAGVNDWGAVSPAPDAGSGPQARWPGLARLEAATRAAGCQLVARLCAYPEYVRDFDRALGWFHPGVLRHVLAASDGEGLARQDGGGPARQDGGGPARHDGGGPARHDGRGSAGPPPAPAWFAPAPIRPEVRAVLRRAEDGQTLEEPELELLFGARGEETEALARLADATRREVNGDLVTYLVNRDVGATGGCCSGRQPCGYGTDADTGVGAGSPPGALSGRPNEALSGRPNEALGGWPQEALGGRLQEALGGWPQGGVGGRPQGALGGWSHGAVVDLVVEQAREAAARGATEVHVQAGDHPACSGDFHVALCSAVKAALPELHLHGFSPLEVHQGAASQDRTVAEQLALLKLAGLGSLGGTGAEVLDDRVRRHLCPDELTTRQWLEVVADAHRQGLPTTSTITFGGLEGPESWARHLVVLRDLQARTGGITEFVPLPAGRRRRGRHGPSWEEVVKMHAVARLALRGWIDNIQVCWARFGTGGCAQLLRAGANDLGGVPPGPLAPGAAGDGTATATGDATATGNSTATAIATGDGTAIATGDGTATGTTTGDGTATGDATGDGEQPVARVHALIRSLGRVPAERTALYAIRRVFDPAQDRHRQA